MLESQLNTIVVIKLFVFYLRSNKILNNQKLDMKSENIINIFASFQKREHEPITWNSLRGSWIIGSPDGAPEV